MSIHELDAKKNESFPEFRVRLGGVEIFTNIDLKTLPREEKLNSAPEVLRQGPVGPLSKF